MDAKETLIKLIQDGLPLLTNAAKAVPADKYDWKPEPTARSTRELFTEAVTMLSNTAKMLDQHEIPSDYDEVSKGNSAKNADELSLQAQQDSQTLFAAIRAFPQADVETTIDLPCGVFSYFQMMSYPYWNLIWHAGQINYIQTLYGDTQMH